MKWKIKDSLLIANAQNMKSMILDHPKYSADLIKLQMHKIFCRLVSDGFKKYKWTKQVFNIKNL